MALWSVSSLEEDGERDEEGEEGEKRPPMAEHVRKLEPIIKFTNVSHETDAPAHCERVRNLAYNKDRYVSLP